MSADCFTWHPDQDDVYDGNLCGSMTLNGPPSAFNKDQPYNFTMKGAPGDSLTLEVAATATDHTTRWGSRDNLYDVTRFDIQSGTFAYQSQEAALRIGSDFGRLSGNVIFTIKGRCILDTRAISGVNVMNTSYPCTQIDINESGALSVLSRSFDGYFTVNIANTGTMQVTTDVIDLTGGSFTASGIAPSGGYSLDLTATAPLQEETKGNTGLSAVTITCRSSSKALLQSNSLTLTSGTDIRAEDTATVEVRCNAFTASGSVFKLSQGAEFRFSNKSGDGNFPLGTKTLEGILNFITIGSENTGRFLFRATSQQDAQKQYNNILLRLMIAIDGQTYAGGTINGYKLTYAYDGTSYLVISLIKD